MVGSALIKSELIAEMAAAHTQLRGEDVETIVAAILDGITSALARGDRVELRGFGAFTVRRRDPRTGRNPRTGQPVPVEAKSVPFFKAGKDLLLRVQARKIASADRKRG
jgi:integration host factor subunit beta